MSRFNLSAAFIEKYKNEKPPFGFNGLGELVYMRTYSRIKPDGKNEMWWETVQRVVEGTYNMQKNWIDQHGLGWNPWKAQHSAQEMYTRMFTMKFLPPGRGIWSQGSALTEEKKLFAALNNCGFCSTETIKEDLSKSFCFLMDMSMLGVGIGFDTKGAGMILVKGQDHSRTTEVYEIPDSREGWVESVRRLIDSFLLGTGEVQFDYGLIRAEGEPIKGFGGVASGPVPLKELHEQIRIIMGANSGEPITVTTIVDIMNHIGKCVVAGNVRRTAEIVFGDPTNDEYLDLKNYDVNPHRADFGWTSNNSIFAQLGMDYGPSCERVVRNGEPGFAWLENMQGYSRMNNGPDFKDARASGGNPCFTGDTLIATADGRGSVPIKQLAEEEVDVPVYTLNVATGMVEIKWGRSPRLTRKNAELVEVVLDDHTSIRCTPDHGFILRDGTKIPAKDLKKGDSLARMNITKEKMKSDGQRYWQVATNTRDVRKSGSRIMEHRLIADFHYPEVKKELYDDAKSNGWLKGGLVVHHNDYNGLNNSPDNLEWMTFRDHTKFHAERDNVGENNPMFGKSHSKSAKRLIGEKSKENWESQREAMIEKITEGMQDEDVLAKISETTRRAYLLRNLENAKNSGLDTLIVDGSLYVQKTCKVCDEAMTLPWGRRASVACSNTCQINYLATMDKRVENQREYFIDRQQDVLNSQIDVYNDLRMELDRDPMMKEWQAECKSRGISYRIRNGYDGDNHYVLKSYRDLKDRACVFNHKVREVRVLDEREDVYNLTTDDNHTYCVVPDPQSRCGILISNCLEQTLESYELCTLVETFPYRHESFEDYRKTLKYAYLYAKTVTLGKTHWPETNRVLLRNRRIGCSVSGVAQFITYHGIHELQNWLTQGYDEIQRLDKEYSDWLSIPRSIKTTSVKPSGTVSLLAGATPGMHYPESRFYIRRIRLSKHSTLLKPLERAGYVIEDAYGSEDTTVVVEVPVDVGEGIRTVSQLTVWEQLALAAFMQRYWADNQVSCTVTFNPETEGNQIAPALNYYQYQLKGISFLPKIDSGAYPQMPYEEITEERYNEIAAGLKKLNFSRVKNAEAIPEKFCANDTCEIDFALPTET